MEKIRVGVYRAADIGDCTNGGVTSRHESMTLFYDCSRQEAVDYCTEHDIDVDECLWLQPRELWGHDHSMAVPLMKGEGCGPMFGGNFVYTSDSRLPRVEGWLHAPIAVHDRYETREDYLSND